ncbi:MAG: helix-turn-helix transcriptional regulator [Bacteroidota bacterium]|jgi:predicted DNA-binding transcriptional regulator YafY
MLNQHRILRVLKLVRYLRGEPAKGMTQIAFHLKTSERTVYRYLEMLKDLGFDLHRDPTNNRVKIVGSHQDLLPFTPQENQFMAQVIRSAAMNHPLADSVLSKLEMGTGTVGQSSGPTDNLYLGHLGHLIETISSAIEAGKQIRIIAYASAHSQTIEDRIVEPVCFTEQYRSLSAFEVATQTNKYFNIERMGDVEILDQDIQHKAEHRYFKPDVFGFQGQEPVRDVEMELSLRGMLLLREQYPASAALITRIGNEARYRFKAKVQDFRAPGAFALRLPEEVRVLGSPEFLDYLQSLSRELS